MKIGLEVQRLFRKRKFGIEISALELINALKDLEPKHQFVVFARKDEDLNCIEESENVKIRFVGGKMFADFEQILLPIAASREEVDLLHCTGNTAPFFSPVPVIQTLHDVIFMDAIPSGDSLYQRFGNHYRRRIVPLVTPRSKVVITVSQYEKERIVRRLGIDREKVHVVYNGINEERFNANTLTSEVRRAVRERYRLPERFILFLGNEATRKNPSRTIEAYMRYAARVQDPMPLVTPGLSEKFVLHQLEQLKALHQKHLFISPGYIDDEHLPALYALSHIFLFPSLSEGFGMPLVEAMACGAPVVTSSTSCLPEIAGNAALLANPLKPVEIAEGILALATNEELRKKKIQAGLENASRFSWKRSAEAVLALYEAVYAEMKARQKHPGFLNKYVFATKN